MDVAQQAEGDRAVMEVGREVGAVTQAAAILRAVAGARDALGVTAIARAAGVSPSTTLNILRTLVHEGFVALAPDTKTYRLGLGLLEVARPLLNRSDVELLQPGLQQVATEFEATTSVWQVAPDDKALLLGRIVPASGIHIEFRLATRIPAYAGAIGRAVAAASRNAGTLPRATLRARFGAIRWHVPVPFETFSTEVEACAERGYAVDIGHLIRGVTSVAAALCDRTGRPRLVVAAHLFQGQLTEERLEALGLTLRGLAGTAQPAMFGVAEAAAARRGGR
ncbi:MULTISPECIES: IclR family transcriptional regulator [Methylobacterium]|uniref:IclR family transcriptional regulator n=1 Tax=Methylobacterium TaxID=407 RepID=UPI0013EDDE65|nr:IclR family transcriptional regulator [Methylobacterium sp. DB0501]NGM33478.1 IclR family transcriptional regulator [Methylobacterium sp. DB0501]